jgi:hypothetical protein
MICGQSNTEACFLGVILLYPANFHSTDCSVLINHTTIDVTMIGCSIYGSTALVDLGRFCSFLILYTVGRTPWRGVQPVKRSPPTHRTNADKHQCFSGIRTHDLSVRAGEDGSCLRPRGHCNRLIGCSVPIKVSFGRPYSY